MPLIFPHLRTKRLSVRMRELTLGDAIALCALPQERPEAVTTELLRKVAADAESTAPYVGDPRLWTVEERALAMCHYMARVSPLGSNFDVGDGKFTDYVRLDRDLAQPHHDIGDVGGVRMVVRPLLGVHVEMLERMCENAGDWLLGVLAMQVWEAQESMPNWAALPDAELLALVTKRLAAVRALPESEFEALLAGHVAGSLALQHFFEPTVSGDGIVFAAREAGLGPARFRALACISTTTRRIFSRTEEPGG